MEKNDLKLMTDEEGVVEFSVRGKCTDDDLALLQRVYVLRLSDRNGDTYLPAGDNLLDRLGSSNIPSTVAMQSMLATACANVKAALDQEDSDRISDIYTDVVASSGDTVSVQLTIEFIDGMTISGRIK